MTGKRGKAGGRATDGTAPGLRGRGSAPLRNHDGIRSSPTGTRGGPAAGRSRGNQTTGQPDNRATGCLKSRRVGRRGAETHFRR
jgi:hypothetical protein